MEGPYRPPTFTCVTCELEIPHAPVIHVGLPFCCAGCVAGGPCTCSYDEPARLTVGGTLVELEVGATGDGADLALAVG